MRINTSSMRNNLTLRVMFCLSERVPQALHHNLIGMHKIRYGPVSILFFTSALIVSSSNDFDLHQ